MILNIRGYQLGLMADQLFHIRIEHDVSANTRRFQIVINFYPTDSYFPSDKNITLAESAIPFWAGTNRM